MKTSRLLELAEKHHWSTDYLFDNDGKTKHKVWSFTEDQLKKFVHDIKKEAKKTMVRK